MVEMGGLFNPIKESIAARQGKKYLKVTLAISWQDDKLYGKNVLIYFLPHEWALFSVSRLQINPTGTALVSRAGSGYKSWLIWTSYRSLVVTSRFLSSSFQSHPSSWWIQWTNSDCISRSTKRSKNTCRVIRNKVLLQENNSFYLTQAE